MHSSPLLLVLYVYVIGRTNTSGGSSPTFQVMRQSVPLAVNEDTSPLPLLGGQESSIVLFDLATALLLVEQQEWPGPFL